MDESLGVRANILLMDADPARAASRCAQFVGFGWLVTPVMGPRDALAAVAAWTPSEPPVMRIVLRRKVHSEQ